MKRFWNIAATIAMLAIVFTGQNASAQEHDGHQYHHHQHGAGTAASQGPNGGVLQTAGSYRVETVVSPRGMMFVLYDAQGNLVPATSASGSVRLRIGDGPKSYEFSLQPLKNEALGAGVDLSKVVGYPLHMDVTINGIGQEPLSFHVATAIDGVSDALLISLQKTCPVSGKPLGSMGTPPKVMVKGKPLFVCCNGCKGKVQANPDAYLSRYYAPRGKEVRPNVFEATMADASAIARQRKCPVMDEPLGGMGAPMKVNVQGKAVFICCAACAKKLAAEPEKYLAKLAAQGVTPPKF